MSKVRYQMKAKERTIWWNYATNACDTYQLVDIKEGLQQCQTVKSYDIIIN